MFFVARGFGHALLSLYVQRWYYGVSDTCMTATPDIDKAKKIYLIGIGGIGMSALARFFVQEKKSVCGSDATPSVITEGLETLGIKIQYEQKEENIDDSTDLFVYSEAVSDDNPELRAARATGKPIINYFQALGLVANPYYLIAVAGTHGKTTTTAMLTDIFAAAGNDPTAIIGSLRAKTKSNFRAGKSKYALVEACEFRRDFLHLRPDVLVITNIEYEHVDYYSDLADVQSAFRELIDQVHDTGAIVTDTNHPNIAPILTEVQVPIIDYHKFFDPTLKLYAPGIHTTQNAAAALAVADHEKISMSTAKNALEEFTGTWRRFEYKGKVNGAPVYDDYAHHPTEIKKTLAGLREWYPRHRIIAVFQPHTFSRTKELFTDFARAFKDADEVLVTPIYAAREENHSGVNSRELAVKILEYGPHAEYRPSFEETADVVRSRSNDKAVVIILGAGPITEVATSLVG